MTNIKKICQNPECGKPIKAKAHGKRLYCDDTCKNRAHYLKDQQENRIRNEYNKGLTKNYRILKKLKALGFTEVSYETLVSHEFNFTTLTKDVELVIDGKKIQCSAVFDIYFKIVNRTLIFI